MRFPQVTAVSTLLATALLSSCTSTRTISVSIAEIDPDFNFDGVYLASVQDHGGRQYVEHWQFNCGPIDIKQVFSVVYSEIGWRGNHQNEAVGVGYVNEIGEFKVNIPNSSVTGADSDASQVISADILNLIVKGNLDPEDMKGVLTYSVQPCQEKGCTYRMKIAKENAGVL